MVVVVVVILIELLRLNLQKADCHWKGFVCILTLSVDWNSVTIVSFECATDKIKFELLLKF